MSTETVAIIDYGSGNLHSAAKAFERAARESGRDAQICLTADPEVVAKADRVVLPGVGAYADCRRGLDAVPGMVEAMTQVAHRDGKPFLGICVGMQLLATRGLEYTVTPGLGWIPGDVGLIKPSDPTLKVPHMGWNTLRPRRDHALLDHLQLRRDGLLQLLHHLLVLLARLDARLVALVLERVRVGHAAADGLVDLLHRPRVLDLVV